MRQGFVQSVFSLTYAFPRILNIPVPQVGHVPFTAFRLFFITISLASLISFFALHFTQYPSMIRFFKVNE